VNLTYAVAETEATIAAHKLGFDPSLGLMHALPIEPRDRPDGARTSGRR
jgi:hypothetical protein